jgi:hypothetical protein
MIKDAEDKGNEIINPLVHPPQHHHRQRPHGSGDVEEDVRQPDQEPHQLLHLPLRLLDAETVKAVSDAGHLGRRAGIRDAYDGFTNPPINPAVVPTDASMTGNDLSLVFDVWPRAYSKYALYPAKDLLNIHVFNAIDKGGFALREFHSITAKDEPPKDDSEGFGPVPIRTYEAHLDFLVNAWKANQVWTSTPTRIIKYRHARTAARRRSPQPATSTSPSKPRLHQVRHAHQRDRQERQGRPGLKAMQGRTRSSCASWGTGCFSVTADPTAGPVDLSGCATAVPGVESVPLPARPDAGQLGLRSREGGGHGWGRPDGRPRALGRLPPDPPQPAQRTAAPGSWSNYPGMPSSS